MFDPEFDSENIFESMIPFLSESTNSSSIMQRQGIELSKEEIMHRVFFASNYLMILRIQGRVSSDPDALLSYNEVVDSYIRFLAKTNAQDQESKGLFFLSTTQASADMVAFYTATGLIGRDE